MHETYDALQRRGWFIYLLLFLSSVACSSTTQATERQREWIVVTAPAFRQAIEPLRLYREAAGFHTTVITTTDVPGPDEIRLGDAAKLRDRLVALCRAAPDRTYVLLVGITGATGGAEVSKTVPTLRGSIGRMKDQPTDNGFGCLGADLLPVVAVGRFPARTPEEVRDMVGKTIRFERDGRDAAWRRSMTLLIGNPGGDSAAERALANWYVGTACQATTERINPCWSLRAIYHIPGSPWYLPDSSLHDKTVESIQVGQAFTCYLGHSDASGFWSGGAPFLDRGDWSTLKLSHGAGIFVTCGCFACQSDPAGRAEQEGYGLAGMRNTAGPVAVIGASGESYAAMGQLAFTGLLDDFAAPKLPDRLGEAWLHLKAGIAKGPMDFFTFMMFDHGDGSNGTVPLATQRQEHLEMWMLLGDPALRLPSIAPEISIDALKSAPAGAAVTLRGSLPAGLANARVRITVERPTGGQPRNLEPVPAGPSDARNRAMLANHAKANEPVLLAVETTAHDGRFEVTLRLPDELPWSRVILRGSAGEKEGGAMGFSVVELEGRTDEQDKK